jgi:hypothetical protein
MNAEAAHLANYQRVANLDLNLMAVLLNSKSKECIPFGPGNGFVPEGMPVFGLRNNSQTNVANRRTTTTATVFTILTFGDF